MFPAENYTRDGKNKSIGTVFYRNEMFCSKSSIVL